MNPQAIAIRHSTAVTVMWFCLAGAMLLVGGLNFYGQNNMWPVPVITGAIALGAAVMSISKPYAVFDPANGTFTLYSAIGATSRVFGPAKGEHLYFDGKHVIRGMPDGKSRRVSMSTANREDVARLATVLPRI